MQPQQPSRQTLPRAARIRLRTDFDRVFARRNRASNGLLTVYMARTGQPLARLGIAAGRRLGNAVARNRAKRLVREAFRRYRHELPPGTDWVVVPARADAALNEVDDSLRRLCARLLRREAEQAPRSAEGR